MTKQFNWARRAAVLAVAYGVAARHAAVVREEDGLGRNDRRSREGAGVRQEQYRHARGRDGRAGGEARGVSEPSRKWYVIGVIAEAKKNDDVFQAARTGAKDAARDLSKELGVDITINWRTPNEEDAQQQSTFVEQLTSQGVAGIAISCFSDANLATTQSTRRSTRACAS